MAKLGKLQKQQLIADIDTGRFTVTELASKYGIAISTCHGHIQRRKAARLKDAGDPTKVKTTIEGEVLIPKGVDSRTWLEAVRDSDDVPWDVRKAAGVALFKSEGQVDDEKFEPAADPVAFAKELALLILSQPPAVCDAVRDELVLRLGPASQQPA